LHQPEAASAFGDGLNVDDLHRNAAELEIARRISQRHVQLHLVEIISDHWLCLPVSATAMRR